LQHLQVTGAWGAPGLGLAQGHGLSGWLGRHGEAPFGLRVNSVLASVRWKKLTAA
jgi:hypothetical protein